MHCAIWGYFCALLIFTLYYSHQLIECSSEKPITKQDYEPKTREVFIGFKCDDNGNPPEGKTLEGLEYQFSITNMRNYAECDDINSLKKPPLVGDINCGKYISAITKKTFMSR